MTRNVFLVIGAIIGVAIAAPIVLTYATVWWWLSVPAVLAYTVVLWRWGMAWAIDDDDINQAPVLTRIGALLILLLWSFIGLALLVFIAMLAIQNWFAVAAAFLLLALIALGLWISSLFDKKKAARPKPDDLVR